MLKKPYAGDVEKVKNGRGIFAKRGGQGCEQESAQMYANPWAMYVWPDGRIHQPDQRQQSLWLSDIASSSRTAYCGYVRRESFVIVHAVDDKDLGHCA